MFVLFGFENRSFFILGLALFCEVLDYLLFLFGSSGDYCASLKNGASASHLLENFLKTLDGRTGLSI
jgi:hypothetical protein